MKKCTSVLIGLILSSNLNAQGWSYVGSPHISENNPVPSYSEIFYDVNNVMHVGYVTGTSQSKITVLKWDGIAWSTVFQHTLNRVVTDLEYKIDVNGDFYIAYGANYVSQKMWRVKKYSGGTWNFMGDSIVSYNVALVDFEIADNNFYLLADRKIHKWDSGGSTWQEIHSVQSGSQFAGGVLNVDGMQNLCYLQLNNILFTADYYLKLEKYNGTSWTSIADTVPVTNAVYMHLMLNSNDEPVIGFATSGGPTPDRNVIHYNGSSWQNIGDLSATPDASGPFTIALTTDDKPIFSASGYGGKVYEFDGSTYQMLDSAVVSGPILQILDVSIHPVTGKRYILFNELNTAMTAAVLSVMEYDGETNGIQEAKSKENDFIIYPNPAGNVVNVLNIPAGSVISIFDMTGKIVYHTIDASATELISVENIQSGPYVVRVESNGIVSNKKLIISK